MPLWTGEDLSVHTIHFEVGVFDTSAVDLSGTKLFASGKYAAKLPFGISYGTKSHDADSLVSPLKWLVMSTFVLDFQPRATMSSAFMNRTRL